MSDDIFALARAALEDDAKATPGPWRHREIIHDNQLIADVVQAGNGPWIPETSFGDYASADYEPADAAFIAAARTREPALAREVIRLRMAFEETIKSLKLDGSVKFSGCEWCGSVWPKTDADTFETIQQRAREHVFACKSHPMKIERDTLHAELARVTPIVDAAKNWRPQVGECRPLPDGRACECEDCWLIRAIDDAAAKGAE